MARAGKAVLCTKPLARTAAEARRMLEAVEKAGVFAGYLEDLVYTPKTLKAVRSVQQGAIGDVTWVRSRETHPGPHSAWFWDGRLTGGGAIVDLGCHCIEIARSFVGKGNRPVEVMCHADTLVHPIDDEDNADRPHPLRVGRDRAVRGELDVPRRDGPARRGRRHPRHDVGQPLPAHRLRDVHHRRVRAATWPRRPRRTKGWLFPVGDEVSSWAMSTCSATCSARSRAARRRSETFYDGYVVNAVMDAAFRSARSRAWEPVELAEWRGGDAPRIGAGREPERHEGKVVIKREILPTAATSSS